MSDASPKVGAEAMIINDKLVTIIQRSYDDEQSYPASMTDEERDATVKQVQERGAQDELSLDNTPRLPMISVGRDTAIIQ
jgi:hypothetical protein